MAAKNVLPGARKQSPVSRGIAFASAAVFALSSVACEGIVNSRNAERASKPVVAAMQSAPSASHPAAQKLSGSFAVSYANTPVGFSKEDSREFMDALKNAPPEDAGRIYLEVCSANSLKPTSLILQELKALIEKNAGEQDLVFAVLMMASNSSIFWLRNESDALYRVAAGPQTHESLQQIDDALSSSASPRVKAALDWYRGSALALELGSGVASENTLLGQALALRVGSQIKGFIPF